VERIIGILEGASIIDIHQGKPWPQVRMCAAADQPLRQIGNGAAFKQLVEVLKDRYSRVRTWAGTGLIYLRMSFKYEKLKKIIYEVPG